MKKSRFTIVLALAAVLLLSSCFSLPGGSSGSGGFNPFAGIQQAASDRASAEIMSATCLTGLTRKLMFNMIYSQVYYMGGFGANLYELEETQGAVWRIQSRDEEGRVSAVDAERALLKKMPNGDAWWYLSWRSEGEVYEFEALMDKDNQARKIRYYNPDVRRIEEAVFNEHAKTDSEEAPPPEPGASNLDKNDLSSLSRGWEIISVNSGSYLTERLEWFFVDEEENAAYNYKWWVDSKTAGGLVKYEWTKANARDSLSGELYSLKKGYQTKYNSF